MDIFSEIFSKISDDTLDEKKISSVFADKPISFFFYI